jgi:hypothetical protein
LTPSAPVAPPAPWTITVSALAQTALAVIKAKESAVFRNSRVMNERSVAFRMLAPHLRNLLIARSRLPDGIVGRSHRSDKAQLCDVRVDKVRTRGPFRAARQGRSAERVKAPGHVDEVLGQGALRREERSDLRFTLSKRHFAMH